MKTSKGDFIEIEFVGRVKDGSIFDTNREKVAKKEQLNIQVKPLIVCVGHGMVVSGFDKALEDKEIEKEYAAELQPKEAFGERQSSLVKIIPTKIFHKQNINPQPGMSFMMDNYLVRISAVSGGRVTVDFNNPLAGKTLIYEFTIKRKIENNEEKVKALMNFFFNQEFPFTIEKNDEKETVVINIEKDKQEQANMAIMIESLKENWKEMLKLEVEVKEPGKKEGEKEIEISQSENK